MASTRRIETTLSAINGGLDFAMLNEKAEIYSYENGKRVSDTPIGMRLTLALPGARLTQLAVKFDHDPLPKVTDEMIAEACMSCNFMYVQIPDCVVNVYASSSTGGLGMTGTAQTAQLVTLGNSK